MQFTLKGFTTQDVEDFAKSKQWKKTIEVGEEQVENSISAGQHCKDYFKMLIKNDIVAYRLKVARLKLEEPAEPEITVE